MIKKMKNEFYEIGTTKIINEFKKANDKDRSLCLEILEADGELKMGNSKLMLSTLFLKSHFIAFMMFFLLLYLFIATTNIFLISILIAGFISIYIYKKYLKLQCQFLLNLINKEILEPESKEHIERIKEKQLKEKQKRAMNLYINKEKI
jgi:hypothetical protein